MVLTDNLEVVGRSGNTACVIPEFRLMEKVLHYSGS